MNIILLVIDFHKTYSNVIIVEKMLNKYLYLGYMDFKTNKWMRYHKIHDSHSRPWFFVYKDDLYLMHTSEEIARRYTNISPVRIPQTGYDCLDNMIYCETVATIKNCGFNFATAEYVGNIYFVATRCTESFGRLNMEYYDEDVVNKKLLKIFNEK